MEYKVITQKVSGVITHDVVKCAEELTKEINGQIALGWEPLGGVSMGHTGAVNYLLQAMIKRR